jgi:carboxypeptidase Taq
VTQFEQLKEKLAEISDLNGAASVLAWDQQTYMPPGGGTARAEQLATLGKLAHEMLVSDRIGELLETASAEVAGLPEDSDEAGLIRLVRREYDKARKVPASLVAELARASSLGLEIWVEARETSDFPLFRPALQKIVDLHRELAHCLGFEENLYDALIDQYEPGMKTSQVAQIFSALRTQLVPLVHAISSKIGSVDDSVLRQTYAEPKQWDYGIDVLKRLGYNFKCGRQDKSVHPFSTSFSINDVRITTRLDEHFLPTALFGTLHEGGHALYEQGISPALERTPLAAGASLGIHESQSRLWENLVGRSRGFWRFFFPLLQRLFSEHLGSVTLEGFYRAINRVEPSMIRVEADEVTYNLHVLLRFELEVALMDETLSLSDLPSVWNAKMKEYLGVLPGNDAEGVLQDVHWSSGLIGYFPTYSLGNLISVQLFEKAKSQHPQISQEIEKGEFATLLGWLRRNVHAHGKKFLPADLIERATGGPLQAQPYLTYLTEKYSEIYSL